MSDRFISLKGRVQAVNARILGIEKRYGKDSVIVKRVYHYLNLAQGTDNLTRYRLPKADAGLQYIAKFERALSRTENSAYLTAEGRKSIRDKAIKSFKEGDIADLYLSDSKGNDARLEQLYDAFLSVKDIVNASSDGWSGNVLRAIDKVSDGDVDKNKIIRAAELYQTLSRDPESGLDVEFYDFLRNLED